MQNLLHRTIETGHEYLSPRDEAAPDVLGALRPLVAQALATGAVVSIDAEWSLGCRDHRGHATFGPELRQPRNDRPPLRDRSATTTL